MTGRFQALFDQAHLNGIENFWVVAKAKLARFRRIRSDRYCT